MPWRKEIWGAAGTRGRGHFREYIPFKEKMIDNWCRLLGTNSLKEGAV
jgi:hypothetical protein